MPVKSLYPSAGTTIAQQQARGQNNAYVVATTGGVAYSNGVATEVLQLIYTPPVNVWWELHAHIGLIKKDDAAYHYLQAMFVNMAAGSSAIPAVGSGMTGHVGYAVNTVFGNGIFMGRSDVMQLGSIDMSRVIPLTAGLPYTVGIQWSASGGTWSYHQHQEWLWLEGKAFPR